MLVKANHNFQTLPNLFDDFFRDWSVSNFSDTNTTLPAVNIKEDDNGFAIEVAAPGMDKKDFNINFDNDVLIISSEKKVENEDKGDNYTRKEYSYQSFSRSFRIPENTIDSDKITASYKNGVLLISIPKREEAKPKPARLIAVK
ncbi:MAG: Hsp20/alpha crystallin family protein [Flavobacteriaceae bacterium]|nr:Hsp20/alpha crystallin family protein [Flavobacteriaceae bacterium]